MKQRRAWGEQARGVGAVFCRVIGQVSLTGRLGRYLKEGGSDPWK